MYLTQYENNTQYASSDIFRLFFVCCCRVSPIMYIIHIFWCSPGRWGLHVLINFLNSVPVYPGWLFVPFYGMLLHYFTNYKKIGITLIILFFVPFIVVTASLVFWLTSCSDMWVCLQDSFWDSPWLTFSIQFHFTQDGYFSSFLVYFS